MAKNTQLGQVSMEMALGITLLAVLSFAGIGLWSRINTDMINYVHWYENQRLNWTRNPNSPVTVPKIDYSNLDNALAQLEESIADLTQQRDQYSQEAATDRQESYNIKNRGIQVLRHRRRNMGWYFPLEVWQESRVKMLEAVFKEDVVQELSQQMNELTDKKEKIKEARQFLETDKPDEAKEIMDVLQETLSVQEVLRHQAEKLRAEAEVLDQEVQEMVSRAGDHWSEHFHTNLWSPYAIEKREEAVSDEGLYEEAEANSNLVDPLHNGADIEGLAQSKRRQAEALDQEAERLAEVTSD